MGTFVVVATVLLAFFATTRCGPESKIVDDLCRGILLQSQADADMCFDKSRSHTIRGDRATLIVLCCLGYFLDVSHLYKHYLSDDFGQFVANMTTDKHVINIGNFVMMCKNETKTLNTADFLYWCSNGKSAKVCNSR